MQFCLSVNLRIQENKSQVTPGLFEPCFRRRRELLDKPLGAGRFITLASLKNLKTVRFPASFRLTDKINHLRRMDEIKGS